MAAQSAASLQALSVTTEEYVIYEGGVDGLLRVWMDDKLIWQADQPGPRSELPWVA
jgi:hypothetical protein